MTLKLKVLVRRKKREYVKNGKSEKYKALQREFTIESEKASTIFLKNEFQDIKKSNPSRAYSILKSLGARPGECDEFSDFTLPTHAELGLTAEQSAEKIADFFSSISQEFPPLNVDLLPERVRMKLTDPTEFCDRPTLTEYQVYQTILSAKKTKGGVEGDLPSKIVKEFSPELTTPITKIYNNITRSGQWPIQWKLEHGIPIPKHAQPESESDLRIISLTSFFSKAYEKLVLEWLLFYVKDELNWDQFGGFKGSSICHYLIDLLTFILYNQDLDIPHAVLSVMVDFSNAFNRIDHSLLITILSDLSVPGWLLNIVIGFLSDRSLIVSVKGVKSDKKGLPGGGPQGTILGMFLFLILIMKAGISETDERLGSVITASKHKRRPLERRQQKYIDDLTMSASLNLRNLLISDPQSLCKPLTYHSRTGHRLLQEENPLHEDLLHLTQYTEAHKMKINTSKTKLMLFNTSKTFDFEPEVQLSGNLIETHQELKLLGITLTDDLKWASNTTNISKKCYSRLWMIIRLKKLGATTVDLVDTYIKQIRSILEFGVPVWHPGLTVRDSNILERIQKASLSVILGPSYNTYSGALTALNLNTLASRRESLCLTFALKCERSPRYQYWFKETAKQKTRNVTKYKQVWTRTKRFEKSPLPYLTSLLNEHYRGSS